MSKQIEDKIDYLGKRYSIKGATLVEQMKGDFSCSSPLEQLLKELDLKKYFGSDYVMLNTANWRGYHCEWKIDENGELSMITLYSRSSVLKDIYQLSSMIQKYDGTIRVIDKSGLKADWFSGVIFAREFIDDSDKINGLRLSISNGTVMEVKPCHVGSYFNRRLKNYIEE